jgi:hypothetical protein
MSEINTFAQTGITNARTVGYNRLLKRLNDVSDPDSEIETTQHAEYDSTAPANTGPRPEFMLIAGLPHLRRSVDIAGIDARAPATAGTGLKKEIRRSEINRFI